jgi:hypothetical protein
MIFNRRTAFAIRIAFGALAISLAAQSSETFKTHLSAMAADAKTRAALAGSGSASATLSGAKLTITGSFEGLLSPATKADLRSAAAAGVRGPVIADLTISKAASGTISGSLELAPAQLTSLRKGGIYIQIYSEKAPNGVLWGWLLR